MPHGGEPPGALLVTALPLATNDPYKLQAQVRSDKPSWVEGLPVTPGEPMAEPASIMR